MNSLRLFSGMTPPIEACLPFFKVRAQALIRANSELLYFIASVISSMYRGDILSSSRWWDEEAGQKEAAEIFILLDF